ncbi:hypothetical protein EW146_g3397 [Bondarzewia mesenterica]|uniref:TMEM205-like domain-containing protein n=1 Tax=Bondarzewia mesenterica TaxID=1095465 RepID=A0A4S4LXY9_9AGAM|nr:hypothetical protein EW146_g3397 [Bondarzewia mesenterica]
MSELHVLTFRDLSKLFSPNGAYYLGYSFLFGMSLWVTFFGGVIAFRALPRHQFGALQHRTFPVYFNLAIAISAALLGVWTYSHPAVVNNLGRPHIADVAQAYTLATILVMQALNSFVIGPITSKTMFERHRQEKEEGKAYNEPGVSDAMKALNAKFTRLHGWSSLANLSAFIALAFHGLWLGNFGIHVV